MKDPRTRSLWLHLAGYTFFCGVVAVGFTAVVFAILSIYTELDKAIGLIIACIVGVLFAAVGGVLSASYAIAPLRSIAQALDYVSDAPSEEAAPNIEELHVGREFVSGVIKEIYRLAGSKRKL